MELQELAERRCVDIIINGLTEADADFNFDIEKSSIYLLPKSPHLHRELWHRADVFIIYPDTEDWFDSLKSYTKEGHAYISVHGTTNLDHFVALKKQISYNMLMEPEFIEPLISHIEIFHIPVNIIVSAIKMKAFW